MSSTFTTMLMVALVGGGAAIRLRKGYLRRKAYWDRRSWWRFTGALAVVGSVFGAVLLMASAVDAGLYTRINASTTFRGLWVAAMLVLLLGSTIAGVVVVNWFAMGDPERPCPPLHRLTKWF